MLAALPAISLADARVVEGQAGHTLMAFPVTLSEGSTGPVSVNYSTASGTATATVDYTTTSGVLTFAPGQTSRTLLVPVVGDATVESAETFIMNLTGPVGVTLARGQATASILDDDPVGAAAAITQYRLYSSVTLEHHYTTDANEYVVLGTRGWQQEGAGYAMFHAPGVHKGVFTVPVFRLYHPGILQHFWTTDWYEVTVLVGSGTWNYEGIPGYVLPTATSDTVPVYRLYLPNSPVHLWTTDANEQKVLSTQNGWVGEGVMGYVQRAESITTAAGVTDSTGKVLLSILGQPLSFQLGNIGGKAASGLAVGIGLDPKVPGIGVLVIAHPQDAFFPKTRLLVSVPVDSLNTSSITGDVTAPTVPEVVEIGGVLDDIVNFAKIKAIPGFPAVAGPLEYTGIQHLGTVVSVAQLMNLTLNGRVGAQLAAFPLPSALAAVTTTLTVDQAQAELKQENLITGLKGAIFLGAAFVPPVGTAVAVAPLCGVALDALTNFYTQGALLKCPRGNPSGEVVKVTFLGKSIYACAQVPLAPPGLAVPGTFKLQSPKPGGSLHLLSKENFGSAFAGVVSTAGTVSYSVPPGLYDAVVIPPFPSLSLPERASVTVPPGGGERSIPPRACTLAEDSANYSACVAIFNTTVAACTGTLLQQHACINAASAALNTCSVCVR